jgi:hypothetical protein
VTLRLKATTAQDLHESDVLKLICLPEAVPCPANEAGGPSSVVFTVAAHSDVDLGVTGVLHNMPLAAGTIPVCLSGCDGDTNTVCRASGVPGRLFDAPVPVLAGGVPLCLVPRMASVTGDADIGTGVIDLQAAVATDVYVTDEAKLCPSCAGVCDSGARAGVPCIVDRLATIGASRYALSRSCPPAGDPVGSVAFTIPLTTGTSTVSVACPAATNAMPCPECEDAVCAGDACVARDEHGACIDAKGGVSQTCCASETTRPCFPANVVRTGSAVPPQPAPPDLTYPKTALGATLGGVFCAPSSGVPALDDAVGLPGPGALLVPVREDWN